MSERHPIEVLVVDDERPTRILMERELPQSGCKVVAVPSGEEALEVLSRQEFDVVLLDLKMPGLGGVETLRRLRSSGVTAEVVVLTGHPDVDTAIEAMKLGAYDYLTKPFKLSEVEAVLRRAAEKRQLQEENTALRRMVGRRFIIDQRGRRILSERHPIEVLVVDDERPTRILMERELPQSGCKVVAVPSGEEALEVLSRQEFDVVLLDLKMPGLGGVETLRRLRSSGVTAEVVVLTGHPDVDTAIEAMKLGAYDYLTKPFKLSEVEAVLRRAAEKRQLQEENTALRRMVGRRDDGSVILGESQAMRFLLEMVQRVAGSSAPVLISGETGTGKGLIARTLHQASPRGDQPFLVINCSAFQDQLLESELFGHEKGAFTGAASAKAGLFEVAHRGTVFLDEVAEMSPAMQAKLLQVLDTGELRRVGGTKERRVDTRIFAATNKDLHEEVRAGRFREDLFFRLNVVSLAVPPLRDRKEDIPPLVEHFFRQFRLPGQQKKSVSPEVMRLLMQYAWPGNVRELANTIERLVLLAPGTIIVPEDLPSNIRPTLDLPSEEGDAPLPLAEVERISIIRTLKYTQGKKAPAARLLGIDVKTLTHKIERYNIHI